MPLPLILSLRASAHAGVAIRISIREPVRNPYRFTLARYGSRCRPVSVWEAPPGGAPSVGPGASGDREHRRQAERQKPVGAMPTARVVREYPVIANQCRSTGVAIRSCPLVRAGVGIRLHGAVSPKRHVGPRFRPLVRAICHCEHSDARVTRDIPSSAARTLVWQSVLARWCGKTESNRPHSFLEFTHECLSPDAA